MDANVRYMSDIQVIKPALESYFHASKYSVEVRRSITHSVEIMEILLNNIKFNFPFKRLDLGFLLPNVAKLNDIICSMW